MNLIELEKKIKEHEVIQKFKDGVTDAMLHGTRDEKQSHHYYKQGYDFGIELFCKQEEWTHDWCSCQVMSAIAHTLGVSAFATYLLILPRYLSAQ